MKRTFIAIPVRVTPELRQLLQHLRMELVKESIKWVEPEILHLTLKFLGETREDQVNEISEQIATIFSGCFVMKNSLMGLNYFTNGGKPAVLFTGLENTFETEEMAFQVNQQLASIGFPAESKPFKSHLTLARIKYLHDTTRFKTLVRQFSGRGFGEVSLEEAVFFESFLQSSGPVYRPLKVFPFRVGER